MRENAHKVRGLFEKMQGGCNVQDLKEKVRADLKKGRDAAAEERKTLLYPVAAQIKLLVDTPEQIWHAMERHQYLRAARLYQIAKLVYKNLQTSREASRLRLPVMFPVVQRQWDAVSHFRSQILQKSSSRLRAIDADDQTLIETLGAIILLDNVSTKEALNRYLQQRKELLVDYLNHYTKDSSTLSQKLSDIIQLVRQTFFHVAAVFLPPTEAPVPSISPLVAFLTSLADHLQSPPTPIIKSLPAIPLTPIAPNYKTNNHFLYSDKTNVHLIFKHLPTEIANYTPHINLTQDAATPEIVCDMFGKWLEDMMTIVHGQASQMLKTVESGRSLAEIRRKVLNEVESDEKRMALSHKGENADISSLPLGLWDTTCQRLLNKPFSLYFDVFRPIINTRVNELVFSIFSDLAKQPLAVVQPALSKLTPTEIDMRGFAWNVADNSQESINSTVTTKKDLKFVTPALAHILKAFDSQLQSICEDMATLIEFEQPRSKTDSQRSSNALNPALSSLNVQIPTLQVSKSVAQGLENVGEEDDLFSLLNDSKEFGRVFEKACLKVMNEYKDQLVQVLNLESADLTDMNGESRSSFFVLIVMVLIFWLSRFLSLLAINRCLFLGQVARLIAFKSKTLHRIFAPSQDDTSKSALLSTSSYSKLRQPFALRTAPIEKGIVFMENFLLSFDLNLTTKCFFIDTRLTGMQQTLMDVYLLAHSKWIAAVSRTFRVLVETFLKNENWRSTGRYMDVWEEVSIKAEGEQMEEKVRLPANASNLLMQALFKLSEELNRIAGFSIEKATIKRLLLTLAQTTFEVYNDFQSNDFTTDKVSDKGVLQIYFDFMFLDRLLEGAYKSGESTERARLEKMSATILSTIKSRIDPIDLVVFERYLVANVDKFILKTSLLFGSFAFSHAATVDKKSMGLTSTTGAKEIHNIIPMAAHPPRFSLLPVSAPAPSAQVSTSKSGSADTSNSKRKNIAPVSPTSPTRGGTSASIPPAPAGMPRATVRLVRTSTTQQTQQQQQQTAASTITSMAALGGLSAEKIANRATSFLGQSGMGLAQGFSSFFGSGSGQQASSSSSSSSSTNAHSQQQPK